MRHEWQLLLLGNKLQKTITILCVLSNISKLAPFFPYPKGEHIASHRHPYMPVKLNKFIFFSTVQANETSAPVATPRKRTTETLANIKSIGNLMSASSDQINRQRYIWLSSLKADSAKKVFFLWINSFPEKFDNKKGGNKKKQKTSDLNVVCHKSVNLESKLWCLSEWIYKVIVSPIIPTKLCQDFCPVVRAEILTIFWMYLGETMTS